MVRNVIFDLGGVVLDWNPDRIIANIQPREELQGALKAALFGHSDWRLFDRGGLTEVQLLDRLEIRLDRPRAEISAILDAVRHSLVEKTDTVKLIRELQKRGVPLYCLSNMPVEVNAHLQTHHGFWDAFSGIVISGEVRMMKPEPEVYVHLLDTFKLRAEESVFIDDLPVNVEAAKKIGMRGILFTDAKQCETELQHMLVI